MATIVLQAAGAFLGGALGPLGSAIGAAAGAMAGYVVDRGLIEGTRRLEGPRLGSMRPFQAEEGAPLARVYGTVRTGGNLIWATRFEEAGKTERQGSKGGPRVTTYSYFCNAAFALCEGEIAGVRRIWADGREVDLDLVTIRIHRGTENQPVDPLIEAKQGADNAPAYRGVAYAVLDRFPLGEYGNRIPQFQFEVMRPASRLNGQIRAVALLPGSTEYGLSPLPVTSSPAPGETVQVNRAVLHGGSDLMASLDELQALCPNLEDVALVVTWFGDDLRAGSCTLTPRVTRNDDAGFSRPWQVAAIDRSAASTVSTIEGASAYGGTPSDQTVIDCIAELRQRGLKVTLYPFVMMDVAPGNALPNPYGGTGQPAYPWRGRVTCDPAPGEIGTADKTAGARSQVEAFRGAAATADFSAEDGTVVYSGDAGDWGYRRFLLHYAHLAVAAGGVDAFLIGSELRALTTLRDEAGTFPFVEALCELAGEVRDIIGPDAGITYGADWTEYFGHQPDDGTGDVLFHLDALWAHEAITAVGVDNYMPLSDWRDGDHGGNNPYGFSHPYDRDALRAGIDTGEGFDWHYLNETDRAARERTPITDGAYGKPWVFRRKDLVGWWSNQHVERMGGVEADAPTDWVPRSKPVWFTEIGCPAVDKGPNQPNVFPDAKSSEDALPYHSSGGRSDVAQAAFLRAHLAHWDEADPTFDASANPASPEYDGRMVDPAHIYAWAWDARPFPAFPRQSDLWRDGENWHRGHWLNGRLSTVGVSDLVEAILADHGLEASVTANIDGTVGGYLVDAPNTAREELEPIASLFGISARQGPSGLEFRAEGEAGGAAIELDELVLDERSPAIERRRGGEEGMPTAAELHFVDPLNDYQSAAAFEALPGATGARMVSLRFPGCLEEGAACALVTDWIGRRRDARETIAVAVPPTRVDIAPGSAVRLPGEDTTWLVSEVEQGTSTRIVARRLIRAAATPWRAGNMTVPKTVAIAGAPLALLLDLPAMPGAASATDQFRLAVHARPWRAQAAYASPEATGFAFRASATQAAKLGELLEPVGPRFEGRVDHAAEIMVSLYGGALSSVSKTRLLAGANMAAILSDDGAWEVLQFRAAEEVAPAQWRLTELLRGQFGTGDAMAAGASAGAAFVLLDASVGAAGLRPEQRGLPLNWKIGPVGHDFGGDTFVSLAATGGVRAGLPLAPAHLRAVPAGGDVAVTWIRRGRIDADAWHAGDIPLGEDSERYRVTVRQGDVVLRVAETTASAWTYLADDIAADLPDLPAAIFIEVRQVSASVGEGLPATVDLVIA